jgi:hypothetical protein
MSPKEGPGDDTYLILRGGIEAQCAHFVCPWAVPCWHKVGWKDSLWGGPCVRPSISCCTHREGTPSCNPLAKVQLQRTEPGAPSPNAPSYGEQRVPDNPMVSDEQTISSAVRYPHGGGMVRGYDGTSCLNSPPYVGMLVKETKEHTDPSPFSEQWPSALAPLWGAISSMMSRTKKRKPTE